ncbi:MAG: Uma2 family endonuclease [Blastocatellia bacterium]|nr:Uma2 family endonuclease [Blastocatellia bacterium]
MNAKAPPFRYTLEQYYALLKASDGCYEYEDGEIVSMAGSWEHGVISDNIIYHSRRRLEGSGCPAYSMQTAILTTEWEPFRFADAYIICGEPEIEIIDGIAAIKNPTVIFEVLSPGTETKDRNRKRQAYFAIEGLQSYVLINQYTPVITVYTRRADGWERADTLGLESLIEVADMQLPLSEIYEGVEFR